MQLQERNELAKHRELEAIKERIAQHDRKAQIILLRVVGLNVILLALVICGFR